MSNLSFSFSFQMDMLKTLEDMFWTGSGHVFETCPSAKMPYLSRIHISLLSVMSHLDGPKRTSELDQEQMIYQPSRMARDASTRNQRICCSHFKSYHTNQMVKAESECLALAINNLKFDASSSLKHSELLGLKEDYNNEEIAPKPYHASDKISTSS